MKGLLYMTLCGSLLGLIQAYKYFQDQLPNGENVPHPCLENHIWKGVGHRNRFGGGDRNPFGLDFAANGFKWDRTLCMKDSDGDEKTNGEELGDPDCLWSPGTVPAQKLGLSHPGICEPIDLPKCKEMNKDWDFCDQEDFDCPQIESPDVQNITIKLDTTAVPPTVTNHYCQMFDLPTDTDYHIIATQPALDNANVIHHMLLFGCGDDPDNHMERFRTPGLCSMQSTGVCGGVLAGWTVGSVGKCSDIPAGVKFGKTSVQRVLLQVHWNNPLKKPDYTDGSGITIYFTHKLKPNDMGTVTIGQLGLRIPGGKVSFNQEGSCSSSCTHRMLNHTLKIVSVSPHMHYLGRGAYVDQYRKGVKVATLVDQGSYSYDSPSPVQHLPPKDLLPGDELKIRCTFKSTSHASAVYYGDGTQDEMCFGFIDYYPALKGFKVCTNVGTYEICGGRSMVSLGAQASLDGCDLTKRDTPEMRAVFGQLLMKCDTSGYECRPACLSLLTENPHPCLSGSAKILQESIMSRRMGETGDAMQKALRSCDSIVYGDYKAIPETSGTPYILSKATLTLPFVVIAMGMML